MPGSVGTSVQRIDAVGKVKGEALYPGDITMDNQAYMKVLYSGRPHAVIRKLNVEKAEKFPGVIAVLTAKDVPVNEFGLIVKDQPVLCGPGSDKSFGDHVRYAADRVAVVVADSEKIAEEALNLIEMEFEDLPIISSIEEALKPNAIRIQPDKDSNIFHHFRIRKGDVDAAFKKADVIVEGDYRTPVQEHAFLQPEAGISYVDDEGRITVVISRTVDTRRPGTGCTRPRSSRG